MVLLLFAYTDQTGCCQEASYGDDTLEPCLDVLSCLVSRGAVLNRVYLIERNQQIELPTAAFDGQLMSYVIRSLQEQWERILC